MFFKTVLLSAALLLPGGAAWADETALTDLLNDFMAGASSNDAAMHDRFWAEDLIYTSSSGTRFGKQDIMSGFDVNAGDDAAEDESTGYSRYWAEEVQIQTYGETAVVAFRLMAEVFASANAVPEASSYFNTGTFVLRDGQWRAVAWQATRIPAPEDG